MNDENITRQQMSHLFALSSNIGLDEPELRELASYVLAREHVRFASLTREEARRVIDSMNGYAAICTLMDQRPAWLARSRAYVRGKFTVSR